MQRATTADSGSATTLAPGSETACPVCGAPVRGIAAAGPGEHRFVGCDHYASGRFLRAADDPTTAGGPRLRLGP